jgi:hypothetical protein
MILTEKQKQAITFEFNLFRDNMYAGKTKEERDDLGQFFTPADLTIQILESLDCTYEDFLDSDVIDPTSGSGNLLAAAIIVGVCPSRVFGNEYDPKMVIACRDRLKSIPDRLLDFDPCWAETIKQNLKKFKDWQVHRGDALDTYCLTTFNETYVWPKATPGDLFSSFF